MNVISPAAEGSVGGNGDAPVCANILNSSLGSGGLDKVIGRRNIRFIWLRYRIISLFVPCSFHGIGFNVASGSLVGFVLRNARLVRSRKLRQLARWFGR